MKKIGLFILSLFTIFIVGNFTQAKDYEYTNLNITANILNDGTINVKEDFTANFFVNKHGIIRDIPLNYTVDGNDFHIEVSNINVKGKKFTTSKNDENIEIKIGDANKTVFGKQNYPISYTTYGLIKNFSGMGYAELYWNLVGYGFDTNINNVRAELILPKNYTGFTKDDFLITTDGNSKTIDGFDGTVDWSSGDKIIITYNKGLQAYHGITLAIKFPNNYFKFDHEKQAKLVGHTTNNLFSKVIGNSILQIVGILGTIILVIFSSKKIYKINSGALKGDFATQYPVIVQYEPPIGLNSAEVGLLLHRGTRAKDILSLIYKWATEGLITLSIEKEKGSFFKKSKEYVIITKNNDIFEELPEYEKKFFKSLVRSEKNKITEYSNLYSKLPLHALEKYGKIHGWFNDSKSHGKLITILGLIILYFLINLMKPSLLAVILGLFGFFSIGILGETASRLKETEEGAKLISHILGYKKFLSTCDENKLRLFLQKDPLYFDKILPYAVVFGLDTELIKKIEPIMQEMNIKSSVYGGDFNSINFINHTVSSAATHSIPPSSSYSSSGGFSGGSSSSGGFSSGGGGGGGGGHSW